MVKEDNFTTYLCKNSRNYYILTYCLHNEGKSVIAESCIKTLKAIKNDSK